MKKTFGVVIIFLSLLIAIGCALYFLEDIIFANIILWIISFPLYIVGQILRTSKAEFKFRGKRWLSIYIFVFFILPLLIYLFVIYGDFKKNTFIDEQFIMYEPSSGEVGVWAIILFLLLVFLFAGRFLNPGLKPKDKGLLNIIIIGTSIVCIGFNYIMFTDYRGVHKEEGLISSNWKGEKQIISFEEIKQIEVEPYLHYASVKDRGEKTKFKWKVTFYPENTEEVMYRFQMVSASNLEQTEDIKNVALDNDIPIIISEMTPKMVKWFDYDLENEELDKKRYYKLFHVNEN